MIDIALGDLASQAEQEFRRRLDPEFGLVSRKIFGESQFRGGFTLEFSDGSRQLVATYADMEFEVRLNGHELFGPAIHDDFAGAMFSREHLREHFPRIVEAAWSHLNGMG